MTNPISPLALSFENLTLGYYRHPAVHHLHIDIPAGSLVAVAGPNGAGKSTLLKGIVGEIRPIQGGIIYHTTGEKKIAYLPQQSSVDMSFPIAIRDFVAMGLWSEFGAFRRFDHDAIARINAAIDAVGLRGLENRPIGNLSGGQFQRARFARLILQNASLVLLDEPYTAIDMATVRDLSSLVATWHREGRTVLSVLHDVTHIRKAYPLTLLLSREMVAFGSTEEALSEENLERANTLARNEANDTAICHVHLEEKPH